MVLLTIVGSKAPYAVRSSVHGVCIGRYYPFLSVSYSAIDTPSLNPSHTSAGSFEDLAAGETSHALPHRASSAKLPTVSFDFCSRWLAFPFSLQSHGTFLIINGF